MGMEATGYSRWFERLLAELGIEVWIGDAAKIRSMRVRKQKTDRQDAQLLLKLLLPTILRPKIWLGMLAVLFVLLMHAVIFYPFLPFLHEQQRFGGRHALLLGQPSKNNRSARQCGRSWDAFFRPAWD